MWKVTRNIIDEGEPECKLFQSVGFDEGLFRTLKHVKFRLLDDDGEVYFWGFMDVNSLHGTEDQAFAPLDSLGRGYGCTELQYREDGEWKTL